MRKKIRHVSIKPIIRNLERSIYDMKVRYLRTGIKPYETEAEYSQKLKKAENLLEELKKYEEKN
jgi:hypothetical protein